MDERSFRGATFRFRHAAVKVGQGDLEDEDDDENDFGSSESGVKRIAIGTLRFPGGCSRRNFLRSEK